MPRAPRASAGGLVYHVLNRANARRRIFETEADYGAFERILGEVQERVPTQLLAWCLMPNHWHLVVRPEADGELSDYMRLVTLTHTQRWHAHRDTAGMGHLYQGRFKSFAVQDDGHFLTVCRYVEANAFRAGLVTRAEQWRWSSLGRLHRGMAEVDPRIADWPVPRPSTWFEWVNEPQPAKEVQALRQSAQRGAPFGSKAWVRTTVERLGLETTLRPRGRPPAEKGSRDLFR